MHRHGSRGARQRVASRAIARAPRTQPASARPPIYVGRALRTSPERFDWQALGLLILAGALGWLSLVATSPGVPR